MRKVLYLSKYKNEPLAGLYIHIPFCKQKCSYCDFHFSVSLKNKEALILAIKKELLLRKNEVQEPVKTIYLGGGTPSIFSYDELAALFEVIYSCYSIDAKAEISLEANPDDLSLAYLKELKKLTINRLSIGVQSFFDTDLQFMNRAHTAKEAISAIKNAQEAGFTNLSIDLIYGVPNMTLDQWNKNLETFLTLQVPHLSSYALTVENRTALAYAIEKNRIKPLDDNLAQLHFENLVDFMKDHNFVQYELSNYAKNGFESKHNTSYWKGEKYLGFGPSAHSFTTATRSWNIANNAKYIKSLKANMLPSEIEVLTKTMQYNEYIMTGLRTIWGVSLHKIEKAFGTQYAIYFNQRVKRYIEQNSVYKMDKDRVGVREKMFFLVDGIIADLFWVD